MKHRDSTQLLFSHSVVSDSLRPHEPQHGRLPCPSPIPRAYSNSCPLHRWCHQPSQLLSSPSPAFSLSQHQGLSQWVSSSHQVAKKYWSFSFSISPCNEYAGLIFFLRLSGLILLSRGLSRVFSRTTIQKHQFFGTQLSLWSNSHIHTWHLNKATPKAWKFRDNLKKCLLTHADTTVTK